MDFDIQINSIINNVCERLGIAVDNLIPELTRYKMTSAIAGCAISGIIFIAFLIIATIIYKRGKKDDDYSYMDTGVTIGVVGFCLAIILLCVFVYQYITWSQAPTGATIKWLIEQIQGIR